MGSRVLVIGGGIGGVQASLDLAQMGIAVTLVEEKPAIGGRMAQLDKTFPTNDCSTCILSPKLVELSAHPNIELCAYSVVERAAREGEAFQVTIRRKARFVDENKCTACGLCSEKCPVKIPDAFNKEIVTTRCIGIPYAQAVPAVYRIDREHCLYLSKGKCGLCSKACPAGAVDYQQQDRLESSAFDAIIVAAGTEEYTPRIRPEFGHGVYANVITSIEYERLLSASGPSGGQIRRPSDGGEPRSVAFLQCVGSRDPAAARRGYCSSYCCMQASKDAIITREHLPQSRAAIFYIDLRAFGKDFDKFVDRAKQEYGVRYVRSRVCEVREDPASGNLTLHYIGPDGAVAGESFDLVVLSVGIAVPDSTRALLAGLGVRTDPWGFCSARYLPDGGNGSSAAAGPAPDSELEPGRTNVPGLFVCGTITAPMDIPETVVSASAAAARAASRILSARAGKGGAAAGKEEAAAKPDAAQPPPPPAAAQPPAIGVVVCRCGVNIASVVDVPAVVQAAGGLANVRFAEEMTYACSQDSIKAIVDRIGELGLNRLVVASCSPRTHEHLFRAALEKAGLNKYLLQMTNIRDQCSWVHRESPGEATEKAIDLVRMAAARARFLQPLEELQSAVTRSCLVIGGGLAGMSAALAVAESGFPVTLLEKEGELGGNLRRLHFTLDTEDIPALLERLERRVREHPLIQVHLGARLEEVGGYVGSFRSTATVAGEDQVFEHGTVIVATGAEEHASKSYGYGADPCVVTQRELETMLVRGNPILRSLDTLAMIQCVDSREEGHNYCSRVCCGEAVKNAIRFKKMYPRKQVIVLYRDVRTYGLIETHYTEARRAGVLFLRYTEERKPRVEKDDQGEFLITLYDEILGREILLRAQLLVLSVGIDAPAGNREIARLLKVPLNEDGFFLEAHVKLRPVDFATDGVFVCGLAHGPKYAREAAAQALAAAGRALTVLSRERISAEAATARVLEERCSGCGLCAEVCPYGAVEIDAASDKAAVNALLCKGCGSCTATCFSGAIEVSGFTNRQIIREFEELLLR